MEFEGLELAGPEDVQRHLLERTTVDPRDGHEWAWLNRLAEVERDWVDAALTAIGEGALTEGELRPNDTLQDVLTFAASCRVTGLVARVDEALRADLSGWSNDHVRWLIDRRIGLRFVEPGSEVLDAVAVLGRRTGCYSTALGLLQAASSERAARFIVEATPDLAKEKGVLEKAAFVYALSGTASHRPAIVSALREAGLLERFRTEVEDCVSRKGKKRAAALMEELDRLAAEG